MSRSIYDDRRTAWKPPVDVVASAAITLSGEQTVDGVALVIGDSCLPIAQGGGASHATNGPYIVRNNAWERRSDLTVSAHAHPGGCYWPVLGGTYAGQVMQLKTVGTITLDTTALEIGLSASGGPIGVEITDPGDAGAIPVVLSGSCALTTAAPETRTMLAPTFACQWLSLSGDVIAGTCTVTVASGLDQFGSTIIEVNGAGDYILLEAAQVAGALVWRVASARGVNVK